jgi:heme exporter protein D
MLGMWVAIPVVVGLLIYFWSAVALLLLILIAVTVPVGVQAQRRVLRQLRSDAYPEEPGRRAPG